MGRTKKITFDDGTSQLFLWAFVTADEGLVTEAIDLRNNTAFPNKFSRGDNITIRKYYDQGRKYFELVFDWSTSDTTISCTLNYIDSIGVKNSAGTLNVMGTTEEVSFYLTYSPSNQTSYEIGFLIRPFSAWSNGNYNQGQAFISGATYNGVTLFDGPTGYYHWFPAGTTIEELYQIGSLQTEAAGGEFLDAFYGNALVRTRRIVTGSTRTSTASRVSAMLIDDFESITEDVPDGPTPTPDPFAPGGTSEPGGGGGTFDDDSDEIPDSSLPTLSAANTGFTRIYNPTLSQVQAMANYLWTDDSVIETIWNHIKQFLEDPMDAFIAFNLIPCAVPNGGTSNFKVMYIDTGVAMTTAANQFVDVDCGTVQLDRYYGSALDYTPYTRVGCFLPYIGTVELDTDEVMGATLQVKYRIDIVSGACVAKIFVDGTCLYQYSGHCAINIPFTSADFSNYVNAIIQVAKAGLIAASGVPITSAGAGEAAEQLTGRTVTTTKTTQRNPATGRQIVTGTETTERDIYSTEASFKGLSPSNLANTVGAVMGSKPMIEHSGGFNGNSGYLGIRRPFLIIKRPRMCNPSGYGALNGYPCMIRETLGNLSGYTQVQQVQLTGLSATNPEQAEILQLLKQGVIL